MDLHGRREFAEHLAEGITRRLLAAVPQASPSYAFPDMRASRDIHRTQYNLSMWLTAHPQNWGCHGTKCLSPQEFWAWDRNLHMPRLNRASRRLKSSSISIMHRAAALCLLIAALGCTPAHAAPTTPDAGDGLHPSDQGERKLPDPLRAAGTATGSRTIDLLIDMQQRGAGLQFNERQRPTRSDEIKPRVMPSAAASAAALPPMAGPRVHVPPVPPSGLFGSGAAPMVQAARTASVEPRGGSTSADAATPRQPGVSSSGEPLPRWLLLPREIIEYVRENRWLVLSSVGGGLLLIWGVSLLFARAAANAGRVPAPRADRDFSADRWRSTRQEARPARRRSHRRPG